MDNETAATVPDSNKEIPYGNLEITIEKADQEQLDQLLEFIAAKVEEMGLIMVARSYMTTDTDDEDSNDEEESAPTPQG